MWLMIFSQCAPAHKHTSVDRLSVDKARGLCFSFFVSSSFYLFYLFVCEAMVKRLGSAQFEASV